MMGVETPPKFNMLQPGYYWIRVKQNPGMEPPVDDLKGWVIGRYIKYLRRFTICGSVGYFTPDEVDVHPEKITLPTELMNQ